MVVRQTVGYLGISYYRIDANANPSRFSTTIAPKFYISAHGAIAHPYVKPTHPASVLRLGPIREYGCESAGRLIPNRLPTVTPGAWLLRHSAETMIGRGRFTLRYGLGFNGSESISWDAHPMFRQVLCTPTSQPNRKR